MNNKRKTKILCVSVMESWGGGELFLYNLISNVKEYEFIVLSPPGEAFKKLSETGTNLIEVKTLKKYYKQSDRWLVRDRLKLFFNIIFTSVKLIKIVLANKSNLILANGNFAGIYALAAAKILKCKLIIIQHLLYANNTPEVRITSFVGKRASKLVCVSNAVASRTREILNNDEVENIVVIHNGIEIPEIEIENKQKERINIGFVGSIIRIKGIDLIVSAVKPLMIKNNLYLHIFGSVTSDKDSEKYLDELKASADKSIENRIVFHGYVDAKDKIYSEIDIAINFSSIPEAFGYNVVEAMAYGKIVIAANAGGTKELIEDCKSGFLVESKNIDSLRARIEYCIENFNSEEMNTIRRQAYKSVKDKFSLEKFTKDYQQFFNSLKV